MRSFQIINGDLALGPSNRLQMVEGKDKLVQDLRLWLQEPHGAGFLTPGFGSRLGDLIGDIDPEEHLREVEDEIERVLRNYQQNQMQRIQDAREFGLLRLFSRREILSEIHEIEATATYDRIVVDVRVSVLADDQDITLTLGLSEEGISVG